MLHAVRFYWKRQARSEATSCEGIQATVLYAYLDWFEQYEDLGQYVMQAGDPVSF
jgi:hypothetical protein